MTKKEYEQACEIEKLKKELKRKDIKIKDLEAEKKTFKNKLNIQAEQLDFLQKENKTLYYKNLYELEKDKNKVLQDLLDAKEQFIAKTRAQLEKNSTNSSKPSSTDSFKRVIHNSRQKTSNKQGGQLGHDYHAPKLVDKPNKTVSLPKKYKCSCGGKIKYSKDLIKRQLIDLYNQYLVTEYQGQVGKCIKCGRVYQPNFPNGINNTVQYGTSTKGFALLLTEYANTPVDKTQDLIGILTNSKGPASGTIMNWKSNIYNKFKIIREDIKDEILKAPIINHDETPYKVNGKQKYAIGAFTENLSVIESTSGREKAAFEKMNIFPRYAGTIMGDHYAVNESFQGQTAFCNAHTIRTARGALDIRKNSMAKEYIDFMYKLKNEVDTSATNRLSKKRYEEVKKEYTKLLEDWKIEFNNHVKSNPNGYYDEERKLINLLLQYKDSHLLFAKKSYVMFTNNLAERGLRPIKSKIKVIGGFRNQAYADAYCCSLSILQTAQKQKLNPCEIFGKIINGERKVFAFQNA